MSATEEDSVFEVDEEEEEDEEGETYFRTEHVSRTEELQEEVDMAAKVIRFGLKSHVEFFCFRRFPCSVSFSV